MSKKRSALRISWFAARRQKQTSLPENAIQFEAPQRVRGTRVPAGSDLLHRQTLRRLLTWPRFRPDLVIVLVDRDGEAQRQTELRNAVSDLIGTTIIAVAIEELEAWLIADEQASAGADHPSPGSFPEPEKLARGEAKQRLDDAVGHGGADRHVVIGRRIAIARKLDLDLVARRCSSFADFISELQNSARNPTVGKT